MADAAVMTTEAGSLGPRAGARGTRRPKGLLRRLGQVVVEMLLILPVFLTIVFTIMEMGYLAFWVLMLNHATYECARVGALIATPPSGGEPRPVTGEMQKIMSRIITSPTALVNSVTEATVMDNQADVMNHDLVVTGSYEVRFVFPLSSILMSSPMLCPRGPGGGRCRISTTVRMPIERPLQQGESVKGMKGPGQKMK